MRDFTETTYGERIADVYDLWYPAIDGRALDLLEELAGGGQVLELGIGTGRVALPLFRRGVTIRGIDASEAMLARLRAKPEGVRIPVTVGDFADVAVEGEHSLVFVLFNTFYALLTQEQQLRCLSNVSRSLRPEGLFLIEAFVPDLARFSGGQAVRAVKVASDEVRLDVTRHDPLAQHIVTQHVMLTEKGIRLFPVKLRYVWVSELDLMARMAGMRLKERWGGWDRAPFGAESTRHVSLYQRMA